jgi:hypothetical protein
LKFAIRVKFRILFLCTLLLVTIAAAGDANGILLRDRGELLGEQDTTLSTDFFSEHLELMAGEGDAIIAQAGFFGGTVTVPYDLSASEFDHLITFIFAVSDQDDWEDYWVGPIWEFRDGATLLLVFRDESYADAINNGNAIAAAVSSEFGIELEPLFGAHVDGESTLIYYDAMTGASMDAYFNSWGGSPYIDGLAPFAGTPMRNAPVRVAGDVLAYDTNDSKWIPWSAAAYIVPQAISIEDGIYNISIADAFGVSPIEGAASADYSGITLRLPYVANIYGMDPETDNLFPELTGKFDWTLKVDALPIYYVNNQYDDISIEYDLNTTDLTTYPQIQADYSINKAELNEGTLNYSLTLTNVGNEEARNVAFAVPLGTPPQNFTIAAFNDTVYNFSNGRVVYWDYEKGEITETDPGLAWNLTIIGWFTYTANDSIVQPVVTLNITSGHYNLDMVSTIAMVHDNVTLFTFAHSDDLIEVDDISHGEKAEPEFGLAGNLSSLAPDESRTVWYAIDNIPNNETALALDFETIKEDIGDQEAVIELRGIQAPFRDWIVNETKEKGGDLRIPGKPGALEWIPGLLFVYEDIAKRNYFGWSNGLAVQLYDNEAILKTTISTDKVLYRVGDDVNVTIEVENIGDARASNVEVTSYHAFMRPGWQIGSIIEFHKASLGDIDPGQTKTTEFMGKADTFLGIHPVFAAVDYTTELGETTNETEFFNQFRYDNVMSNLINAIVLPPEEKDGSDEPSFPTPELDVSAELMSDGNLEVGDEIEVHITITNIGDEPTNIVAISYFANRFLELKRNAYSSGDVKVTDTNGTEWDQYDQGFFADTDFGITYVAAAAIHLEPNDTVHMYYTVKTTAAGIFTVPPVVVEYDSRYPIESPSGTDREEGEGGENAMRLASSDLAHALRETSTPKISTIGSLEEPSDDGRSWSSYSGALSGVIEAGEPEPSSSTSDDTSVATPGFAIAAVAVALPAIAMLHLIRRRRKEK